jgi:hypothetical protein
MSFSSLVNKALNRTLGIQFIRTKTLSDLTQAASEPAAEPPVVLPQPEPQPQPQPKSDSPIPQRNDYLERYITYIAETEGLWREAMFPDLPLVEGRSPLLAQLYGTGVSEAFYLLSCLHSALAVPGDICEFGVAHGTASALVANEILSTDRKLWLFDSFQGLSKPTEKDILVDDILGYGSMDRYEGAFSHPMEQVKYLLRQVSFPSERVRIIPGFIQESIQSADLPNPVCFAYIDFDLYEPIVVTLDYLHRSLSPGGVILIDDYGFFSSGAKTAVDEFAAKHSGDYVLTHPKPFAGHFAMLSKKL